MSGRKVVLTATNLTSLSEVERLSLQKIALAKLQRMDLGCPVTTPKDWTATKRSKRSGFSLKKRTMSGGFLDNFKDKGKDKEGNDSTSAGWTFGIPIGKCVANDSELQRQKPSLVRERRDSLDLTTQTHRPSRKSSSSSGGASGVSSDSLSEADSKSIGSNLLDALSLSSSTTTPDNARRERGMWTHAPQVPYIVHSCLKHLETYGLRVLGIFRIGSSKMRMKQLREEFDSGRDVLLNEKHNPHDVAALLKEYFRDLPDPLLTRDLYSAFIATRKLETTEKRLQALHLLVALLPRANRDTLWALLSFLHVLTQHSTDAVSPTGQELPGNKMDSHNLATLFGPNILHTSKGGEFQVETLERAQESQDVIAIVKEVIDHHQKVFELPVDLYDEMFRLMQETNPEAVDHLLKQKSASIGTEVDGDTCSSMFEESDSSSIPQSPGARSEPDSQLHGRADSLPVPRQHRTLASRIRSVDPPSDSLKVPVGYTVSAPDQGWYRPERSRSPVSPRMSPSPKPSRAPTAKMADSAERTLNASQSCTLNARSGQSRPQQLKLTPSGTLLNKHTLTVPPTVYSKQRHSASSSSSGYYASSSRSGTNSPIEKSSPVVAAWFLDSPPVSPAQHPSPLNSTPSLQDEGAGVWGGDRAAFHKTSSLHRPLHLAASSSESSLSPAETLEHAGKCAGSKSWQLERWKHWEKLARENSDDYHEQETLV
ncbi:hypothetical protein NP493_263g03024 [Ridgeia piscesae]|uniref:Rho-GAP domain-containing protein n=1 Tax=Ridgeia piscesae TaxID=27915 RepID=A0AAD9UCS2_RIDPI|nr:hypothetical protein NP493_263g03024 [Ridgeia piscesae]